MESGEPDMRGVKLIINTPTSQPVVNPRVAVSNTGDSGQKAGALVPTQRATPPKGAASDQATSTLAADPYADLPYLRQLPVATQREIPELKFSVHIYSESRSGRMVKLNGRMMREGQRVASDLSIEAIIPRAVVFNYSGQLFKVPAR